ncbi:DUF4291 family protein [Burkholderia stagnalis]|uniref:DUF4291 family protein n=1 Tax=Burkholderia stagnalis TaxID=1503054 RepID=UPI001E3C7A39|nr:DUF4291 family protein [Burkholderia stagnalis]
MLWVSEPVITRPPCEVASPTTIICNAISTPYNVTDCGATPASRALQWDPERDLSLQPLTHRAIQIGLSKQAVNLYVHEWIQRHGRNSAGT